MSEPKFHVEGVGWLPPEEFKRHIKKVELLTRLRLLAKNGDPEAAHSSADHYLLEFIDDQEITEAFDNITKWYA